MKQTWNQWSSTELSTDHLFIDILKHAERIAAKKALNILWNINFEDTDSDDEVITIPSQANVEINDKIINNIDETTNEVI